MPLPNNAADEKRTEDEQHIQDRRLISDDSKEKVENGIEQVDDPDAADALRELAHILTGDDRFETDE